jgi:serine protease AprX
MLSSPYPHEPGVPGVLPSRVRLNCPPDLTGKGVTIAVLDSGFFPHPDFADRVISHIDATDVPVPSRLRYRRAAWYSWHGTMTAALIAGDGSASGGHYAGIAPEARLVLIKVSNQRRQIKECDIARGLDWLIHHHRDYGIRLINLSVGGDFPSEDRDHPIHRAIRTLTSEGVSVFTASGNKADGDLVPPASSPEAITVGSYDDANSVDEARWRLMGFTKDQHEPHVKPEIIAAASWIASPIIPGSSISRQARWLAPMLSPTADGARMRELLYAGRADLGLTDVDARQPSARVIADLQRKVATLKLIDQNYQFVDGTSVASAMACGTGALLLEANPALCPADIKAVLVETGIEFGNLQQGFWKRIDATAAAAKARAMRQS